MKIAIVLSLVALAMATDFNLELNEGGKKFVEKIKVDTEANTEEYSVPQHGKRVAIDVLKDFTKGLKAEKQVSQGACYVTEISRDDEIPAAVQREMELTKSKFPSNFKVTETMSLPVGEISEAEVGSKIAAHCKGLNLVKVAALTKDSINEAVKGMLSRGDIKISEQRKRSLVGWTICSSSDVDLYLSCPNNYWISCVNQDHESCAYTISCPYSGSTYGCYGTHSLNSITCCRVGCY